MLTREMLAANATLAGLTEEQIVAITDMSRNDENNVIGTRIGTLHGQYDADILSITGIQKNGTEKSYEYAKRVLTQYKNDETEKAATIDKLNKEVAKLTKQIAEGNGDETIKQQLKDTKAQVTQLQAQLATKNTELATEQAKHEKAVNDIHVDYAFTAAINGIKFKDGISEAIQKVLITSAKAEVLAKGKPEFVGDGTEKKLIFRDANGQILNNPSNNLNPYTAKELLLETSIKDVIDTGRQQTGGGTGSNGGGTDVKPIHSVLDLTGVKTQVEADNRIEAQLLADGLTRDSMEFHEKFVTYREENKVADLPIR